MVDVYEYHYSPDLSPLSDRSEEKIFGLELEINDYNCERLLENLEEDCVITTPFNEGETDENIVLEEDGSVAWEMIFRADYHRNIMRRLKRVNRELNPNTVNNGYGTSAHVHLNKRWVQNELELNESDARYEVTRAGEFMFPLLYLVSERGKNDCTEWAKSQFGLSKGFHKRSQIVDNVSITIGDRYMAINNRPDYTIENRIFSNRGGFDYQKIKLYLELTEQMVEIAKIMKGREYSSDYEMAKDHLEDFCFKNRRRKKLLQEYNVEKIFGGVDEEKALEKVLVWKTIQDKIDEMEKSWHRPDLIQIIRVMRDIENEVDYDLPHIPVSSNTGIEELRDVLQTSFVNEYGEL